MITAITYIVVFSTGVIVGFFYGMREKNKFPTQYKDYGMDNNLTIAEQQEDALDEAKRILNDKK